MINVRITQLTALEKIGQQLRPPGGCMAEVTWFWVSVCRWCTCDVNETLQPYLLSD
ncbi:hypothetical protein DPMN_050258 [Dreissena polymorpha]|uniref:Uncharacterized protein n=1 Tax=Dreissena polymorpha TaxID=45954 RepID=A0A9D4CGV1_DREPO|nr:hypothetical protein DPMN_050258 [Dreissena polymorpha]